MHARETGKLTDARAHTELAGLPRLRPPSRGGLPQTPPRGRRTARPEVSVLGRGRFSLAVFRQQVLWKDLEGSGRSPPHLPALNTDWNDLSRMLTFGLRPHGTKQVSTQSWSRSRGPPTPAVASEPTTKVDSLGPSPSPRSPRPNVWVLLGPPRGKERHSGGLWAPLHHLTLVTLGDLFMRGASPAGQVCLHLCESFDPPQSVAHGIFSLTFWKFALNFFIMTVWLRKQ